jgi:hypothetical protein
VDRDQYQPPIALGVMENSVLRTMRRKTKIERGTTRTTKKHREKTILNNYPQGKIIITLNEVGGRAVK